MFFFIFYTRFLILFRFWPWFSILFRSWTWFSILFRFWPWFSILFRFLTWFSILFRFLTWFSILFWFSARVYDDSRELRTPRLVGSLDRDQRCLSFGPSFRLCASWSWCSDVPLVCDFSCCANVDDRKWWSLRTPIARVATAISFASFSTKTKLSYLNR